MADGMSTLRAAKAEVRSVTRRRLKRLSDDHIITQSRRIQEYLVSMPEYKMAKHISIYLSMPSGEVTTRGIVEDALRRGKKVFVPYLYKENVDGETKVSVMDMVSLKSEDDYHSLRADRWGIPIPDPASMTNRSSSLGNNGEEHGIGRLDMIVMPGVAFDRERRRLGHGKGYYDFFLHRYQIRLDSETRDEDTLESRRMPFLVGLALYEQLLPEGQAIPITTSDYALDALIVGDGSFYEKEDRQTPPA